MEALSKFGNSIKEIMEANPILDITGAREIVCLINDFLYTTHDGIGSIKTLGQTFEYFSEFHKFWHEHYSEILDIKIDDKVCAQVAEALHRIYIITEGKAFTEIWDTCGLSDEDVCRVRLFTANQDFRGSLEFEYMANIFNIDHTLFDEDNIIAAPDRYISMIGLSDKSQSDKRKRYAAGIASFIKDHNSSPIDIITEFSNDVSKLREALVACNAGFGYKKADMFIRDMVVLGIWKNVKGFEAIDVASDVNTMKVALRTGILTTAIPLLSSFLDIFCYQYGHVEQQNALAWRRVWEIWRSKYPLESPDSPSLLDFFVYKIIGKEFCKPSLAIFQCEEYGHKFKWHSALNKTCQVCHNAGIKRKKALLIGKVLPCEDPEGEIAIRKTKFAKSLPQGIDLKECPFRSICKEHKNLLPPKSISIKGATGWETAYTRTGQGGGGLMS